MVYSKSSRNEGQAVIEFVLGLLIVLSFFFFFVRMSAVFAVGNYIHYATFMAARAYSSSSGSEEDQRARAQAYLDATISGKFKSLIRPKGTPLIGPGSFYQELGGAAYWNQGVSYPFTAKLSLFPWSRDGQSILINLVSESWMPRNEPEDDCLTVRGKIEKNLAVPNAKVWWDNGC